MRVIVDPLCADDLRDLVRGEVERGGALFGDLLGSSSTKPPHTVVIRDFVVIPNVASRPERLYTPHEEYKAFISGLGMHPSYCNWIGMWHTHQNADASPSDTDMVTMGCAPPGSVMLIVGALGDFRALVRLSGATYIANSVISSTSALCQYWVKQLRDYVEWGSRSWLAPVGSGRVWHVFAPIGSVREWFGAACGCSVRTNLGAGLCLADGIRYGLPLCRRCVCVLKSYGMVLNT